MPENDEVLATNDGNYVKTEQTSQDQETAWPSESLLRRLLVGFIIGAGVLVPLAIAGARCCGADPTGAGLCATCAVTALAWGCFCLEDGIVCAMEHPGSLRFQLTPFASRFR